MLFLISNKTGLWTILILLLLGVSLYPACGRPSFQDEDEDTVADEGHEKEDDNENQVDEHADEDDDDENDSTPSTKTEEKCLNLGKKIIPSFEMLEFCENSAKVAQDRRKGDGGGSLGGAAAEGATASTGGKDEYDDSIHFTP